MIIIMFKKGISRRRELKNDECTRKKDAANKGSLKMMSWAHMPSSDTPAVYSLIQSDETRLSFSKRH